MQRARRKHSWQRGYAVGLSAAGALVSWIALAQPPQTPTSSAAPATPPAATATHAGSATPAAPPRPSVPPAPAATASPAPVTTAAATSKPKTPKGDRLKRWVTLWRSGRSKHRELRLFRLRHRLHELFGGQPLSAALLSELRLHAHRIARIHRIKQLAIEQQDDEVLGRVEALLAREHGRHARWMKHSADEASSAADGGP